MKQTVRLDVPTPCTEDWDKMEPLGSGRHCKQCSKTVVDFTQMADDEIFRFFKEAAKPRAVGAAGGVCGRFMADQLRRELGPAPVQRNGWPGWKWMIAGSLVLSKGPGEGRPAAPLTGGSVNSATAIVPNVGYELPRVMADSSITVRDLPQSAIIVGALSVPPIVVEDSGIVVIPDTSKETQTMGEPVIMGDTTIPVKIDTTELPEVVVKGTVVAKKKDLPFTGGVTVIPSMELSSRAPDTPSLLTKVVDSVFNIFKDTAAAIVPNLKDKVESGSAGVELYPNPVTKGGQVRLVWKGQPGRRQVTLVSTGGEMVGERAFEVAGKGQIDDWVLPQGLAAGLYFLRVVQSGKAVQTAELMVQ